MKNVAQLSCVNNFARIVSCDNPAAGKANNFFTRHFDAVFVINVETETERKRNILQLDDIGCPYYYVPAITPTNEPEAASVVEQVQAEIAGDPDLQITLRYARYDATMICLQLNHIFILNYCIARGFKSCLILEDDFLLHRDIEQLGEQAFSRLPSDWNIVWLGSKQDQRYPPPPHNEHWHTPNLFTWGTHAYGLQNCIEAVRNTLATMRLPVDLHMTHKTHGARKYVATAQLIITLCDGRRIGGEYRTPETYALWNWDVSQYRTALKKAVTIPDVPHGGPWALGCAGIGAWHVFVKALRAIKNQSSDPDAMLFLDFADRNFSWGYNAQQRIQEPWAGILHHPYKLPTSVYGSVQMLFAGAPYRAASQFCQKLFTLSEHLADQLKTDHEILSKQIPVRSFLHPTNLYDDLVPFDISTFIANRSAMLVSLGGAFRRFSTIDKLRCPYIKAWAFGMYPDYLTSMAQEFKHNDYDPTGKTIVLGQLTYNEYNAMLQNNIAFLDVLDSSANNCVLDCIARNTPILTRRHPAIVEYLGVDYPLYFDDVEHAQILANDIEAICDAHYYLRMYNKRPFNFHYALRQLYSML
jgi:GR25 family glycosyltransferase involved in LPS biosynthesis